MKAICLRCNLEYHSAYIRPKYKQKTEIGNYAPSTGEKIANNGMREKAMCPRCGQESDQKVLDPEHGKDIPIIDDRKKTGEQMKLIKGK